MNALDRNTRVQARYDELMREGKHGHYETLFRVVNEEVELAEKAERRHCRNLIERADHRDLPSGWKHRAIDVLRDGQ